MYKYLLFTLLLFSPLSIEATSFDCNKASRVNEKIICSSPNLSNLDDQLSTSYKKTKENALNLDELKKEQVAFIRQTRICDNEDCLTSLYTVRIAELNTTITIKEESVIVESPIKTLVQTERSKDIKDIPSLEAQQETKLTRKKIFAQGKSAFQSGDFDKAIELVRPLAEQGDAEAQLSLGVAYDRGKQEYIEAIKWYKLAVAQGDPIAQQMMGLIYIQGRGVEADKDEGMKWLKLAADRGLESAIRVLKQLAEESNKDKVGIQNIPDETNELNNEQSPAMLPADKELEEDAETFFNRGNVLLELKKYDEALANYDRAIELKPDYAEAYSKRGNALIDLKRLNEALASYDRAIVLKPDYANAYSNRGNTLQRLKRFDEALASYDRAIELKPDSADAYSNRGNALEDLKRFDKAKLSHNRAIALKPELAEFQSDLNIQKQQLNSTKLEFANVKPMKSAIDIQPSQPKAFILPLRIILFTILIFLYCKFRKL